MKKQAGVATTDLPGAGDEPRHFATGPVRTMTNDEIIARPDTAKKPNNLCATPTTADLGSLFQVCQNEGELGLVTGEPGVGKTSAIRHYVTSVRLVFVVTMSPATNTLAGGLARIADTVHAYPDSLGAAALSSAIRRRLAATDGHKLLVIDEAQNLCDACIEEIRAIHDASENLGVVFVGARELRERLSGRRWAQFTSRLFVSVHLKEPKHGDIEAICAAAGVTGKRPTDQLRRAAAGPGGLRQVVKVLGTAAKLAGAGQPIAPEHIEDAVRYRTETAP